MQTAILAFLEILRSDAWGSSVQVVHVLACIGPKREDIVPVLVEMAPDDDGTWHNWWIELSGGYRKIHVVPFAAARF
ncbi:MAG: hypothetical protein C4297_00795 [Gemmataceae bacterium]